jgi:hypothetical protein
VSNESNDGSIKATTADNMVTHVIVNYRDEDGHMGVYSWVNDVEILDIDNYFGRKEYICKKCKKNRTECTCEEPDYEVKNKKQETVKKKRAVIDPVTQTASIVEDEITVDYYVPDIYPVYIRKNVSRANCVLGGSDIQFIKDQQNDSNMLMSKIREKILKGGSVLTLPSKLQFEATDDELKIVRVESPAQMSMIEVKSLQPNVATDMAILDLNYNIGRQTLGINDSFQGRQDTTATSGKAKEFAAAQTAGRLASKIRMKNFAYSRLFELIFKLNLAFADEPRPLINTDEDGNDTNDVFDKTEFIEQDADGTYFYNDYFLYSNDVSGTLANDRQAMWQETRSNFESGAYGDPMQLSTIKMYWKMMNTLHYPGAKGALQSIKEREVEEQRIQQEQMIAEQVANSEVEKLGKEVQGKTMEAEQLKMMAAMKDKELKGKDDELKQTKKQMLVEKTLKNIGGK